MNYRQDTIVAIATPQGVAGVGIVRLSGSKSLEIARQMANLPQIIEPNKMYLTKINAGEFSDKGYCVYFQSPKSFTGEDVIEFQVHGSPIVLQEVVNRATQLGATLANRGEFSQRAFFNGKMSLDEAESLIDLINSTSINEAKATEKLLDGALKNEIVDIQNEITDMLAKIDVSFDYPEHDDETQIGFDIKQDAQKIVDRLQNLLETHKHGQILSNGIDVAIVGKPNVGKSSLLNAMLGTDTAIVTDIAGTTTDTIKESYSFNGIRFNLIDTAGIRDSAGVIESIGIEKSKQSIQNADIVLFVLDTSRKFDDTDNQIYELVKNKTHIALLNKSDLQTCFEKEFKDGISISTQNLNDIEKVKQKIYDLTISQNLAGKDLILINSRHSQAIATALETMQNAINLIDSTSLDCVAVELNYAWTCLGEIVGNTDVESIIDKIFSKFCLGK